MVQMSVRTRACGCVCANTHTHTQWNTQVAAAAGFSRGCQRLQTPLSCWTYGSSLTLWNLCSRRALPSAEINQPWEHSQSGGIGPRALSHVSIAWNHYFLHLRKVIKNNERRRAGLPAVSALDLIPHSVPLCPACRKGFLYFPSWSFFLHPGLRISSSNQHAQKTGTNIYSENHLPRIAFLPF